jgi:glycosyltransferase involved in cell wall biosynthesis
MNSLIDTRIMNPKNRTIAKSVFNLEYDKFYILMGCHNSNDPRKGFDYLIKALIILFSQLSVIDREKIRVLIVSKSNIENSNIPFKTTFVNFITDYRLLSFLYQSSDVFVNSSVEDSGPMMVSEALACGTPVVGFDMGVVNNMVINNYNGYKATLRDSEDLAKGIKTIFELTPFEYKLYSNNSVLQVKEYSSFEYGAKIFNQIINN